MKKLLCALACGALLLCGGMSVARADYYEMYNPATHVEGGAMEYETTRGVLMVEFGNINAYKNFHEVVPPFHKV